MQVLAAAAGTGLGVGFEQLFDFAEQVGIRTKVAEMRVARRLRTFCLDLHGLAVAAVVAVALDQGRGDALAAKDGLEGAGDGGSASAAGTGDAEDGMAFGHGGYRELTAARAARGWRLGSDAKQRAR